MLTEPPFFIIGSGRSGTTLLQTILSAHPRLAVTPETHFCKLSEHLTGVPLHRQPPDYEMFLRDYCANPRFASMDVAPDRWRELIAAQGSLTFGAAFTALLAAYLEKSGKRRIGEKTPGHLHYAGWLFEQFPDARMIVMHRDPRAVIASVLKTPWRKAEPDFGKSAAARRTRLHVIAREARRWERVNGRILPEIARDPRVTTLHYEELAQDPEAAVAKVCAFLGERFDLAMLSNRGVEAQFDPAQAGWNENWSQWIEEHHASARAPVSTGSLEKWRDELSQREVAAIEAVTGPVMSRLGYDAFATPPETRRRAIAAAATAGALDRGERLALRAFRWARRGFGSMAKRFGGGTHGR